MFEHRPSLPATRKNHLCGVFLIYLLYMKFSKLYSAQPDNLSGSIVSVEIDISRGMHSFSIVGMASRAVDEARDRVNSAIKNAEYEAPKSKNEKLVISLAPAELKKDGAYYDLAIALGYLLSAGEINFDPEKKLFLGELSLDGTVKPVRGVLPIIQAAQEQGFTEIFLPTENTVEAALVEGITIYPVKNLKQTIEHLDTNLNDNVFIEKQPSTRIDSSIECIGTDFSDIKGQEIVKRGLEIAAAGGHNVAMFGPPGTGKTMLARAFGSILPNLARDEILEITGIHSVAGTLDNGEVLTQSPVRSPHHTSSYVAIIGGGSNPKPGEITLAHRGVLFLDEFPEFDKKVLESLRQPLEDRVVTISRAQGTALFPASFILLAAMNPCPCGFYGSEKKQCICGAHDIVRYKKKISGPIIDRIDIWLPVEHVDYNKLSENNTSEKISPEIRKRVIDARSFARQRTGEEKLNVEMTARDIQNEDISDDVRSILNKSAEAMQLSPRAYHRVIKLARTIADLEHSKQIQNHHVLEALQYRPQLS